MKVRVSTFQVSDDVLKSIRRAKGQNGKAMREEAQEWIEQVVAESGVALVATYPPHKRAQARADGGTTLPPMA